MTVRNFCDCKPCKKARRKGLVLGTRRGSFWTTSTWSGKPEHYDGPVSDMVLHPKFRKGKRVRRAKMIVDIETQMAYE